MSLNVLLATDAYKTGHNLMMPPCLETEAYMTFRRGLPDTGETRIVWFGIDVLNMLWNYSLLSGYDIDEAVEFFKNFGVGGTPYPFPEQLFRDALKEYGMLPITVKMLPPGTIVRPGIPVLTVSAEGKYAGLATYFESFLMHGWASSTTATKSFIVRDLIKEAFDQSVDEGNYFLMESRLHDFGYRGVSSDESAVWAGMGHLLAFQGTDTILAAFEAGSPGVNSCSVMASEHSVMTSWPSELEAVNHLIDITPNGQILSVVADSYDYYNFCDVIVPSVVQRCREKNIFFVLRPDSGYPPDVVLHGLRALEKAFGSTVNSKGYKVINGAGLIQGDGIDIEMIRKLLKVCQADKFSAQCLAFGMGGGLLQNQTRDTLSAAMKLCYIKYADGTVKEVRKLPKTDLSKASLPGKLGVYREGNEIYVDVAGKEGDLLEIVCRPYIYRPYIDIACYENDVLFHFAKARAREQWDSMTNIPSIPTIGSELRKKLGV